MSTTISHSIMFEENLLEEVQAVVELSQRENEGETETIALESAEFSDALQITSKSLESLNIDNVNIDDSLQTKSTRRSMPSLQTQDSTQRLQSCKSSDDGEPTQRRRPRRRRRSLKDSITALFTSSNHQRRTPSPRDPQRKSSQRSQSFSLSAAFTKRRSMGRRKKSSRHTFSSIEFDLRDTGKMDRRRSGPLRQSSSTAFTSAALEVSENFRDDEKETPPLFANSTN